MKYRKIGNSDISVSEIGFGAWSIAMNWWGKAIDEQEAKRMIKKAYDVGINFFETGDMYGRGKSERLIGEALEGRVTEKYVLDGMIYFPKLCSKPQHKVCIIAYT